MFKFKRDKIARNVIFVLMLLYNVRNVLFEPKSILPQFLVLSYLLICFFYFIKVCMIKRNPIIVKILTIFFLVQAIYVITDGGVHITTFGEEINSLAVFKNICYVLLTFYPFYYFSLNKLITIRSLKIFFVIYVFITILNYYEMAAVIVKDTNEDYFVNNISYTFVSLLPFSVLFINNKSISISIIIFLIVFIMFGSKRGAIIIGFMSLLIYFVYLFKQMDKNKLVKELFVLFLLVIMSSIVIVNYIESNAFLQQRFTQLINGDSSGRDVIYSSAFNYWCNSNIFNNIFGHGFNATIDIVGKFAHNDWLELLTCCGIFGVTIYLFLFLFLYKYAFCKKIDIVKRALLMMIAVVWTMKTLFSMGYADTDTALLILLIGYVVGSYKYDCLLSKHSIHKTIVVTCNQSILQKNFRSE